MKRKINVRVLPIVFSAVFSISAFADVFTWKEGAQGGWDDPLSYVNNAAATPKDEDTVVIPNNVTVIANDEDMAVISKLKNIKTLGSNAKIIFDISQDHEIGCAICGTDDGSSPEGDGAIVKNGSGTLSVTNLGLYSYYVDITVNDGILKLQQTASGRHNNHYRSLTVNHPGVLYTPANTESEPDKANVSMRTQLWGDGMVTNPSPNTVIFSIRGTDSANIPVFSGILGGKIKIQGRTGTVYQDFTGTGSLNSEYVIADYKMNVGIADLGGKNPKTGEVHYGSVGSGGIWFTGESVFRYLGDGQIAYTKITLRESTFESACIDAGAMGGLRLLGTFECSSSTKPLKRLILSGDNVKECSIEGSMNSYASGAVYLTKRGSGTWGLLSDTAFSNGVIAVENGKLKFSSIRNKGEKCSLGAATVLYSDYTGKLTDAGAVPVSYAYLLGTADTLGTMEYVGADEAVCDDRAFAVKGKGCIASSGGPLVLSGGVGSVVSGENFLCLAGTAERCVMNNITNGVGTIKIVKEGPGAWSMGGNLGFTGGIEVKEGVLTIGNNYAPTDSQFADGMGIISVSAGAVLRANGSYEIDELKLGSENGTIDGFSFASSGTLKVSGTGESDKVRLPVSFLNASGLENIKNWSIDCDERKLQIVKADENGVVLSIIGLKVIVR